MIPESAKSLERFLLPNACVVCGSVMPAKEADGLVCPVCRSRARRVIGGCDRCHQPLPPVGPCRCCVAWSPAIRWVRSAFWLENVTRTVVHHLKYENCTTLADLIADLMVGTLPRPAGGWLVPIPAGRRRVRTRGYNQALLIAECLGRRWQLPVASACLRRARETKTQTALTPAARLANVAGAFVGIEAPAMIRAPGSRVRPAILVDDVLTTGATLDAAATALASAGWPTVGAVTFARAMPFQTSVVSNLS